MAEKKKGGLEDEDLEALVSDTAFSSEEHWQLSDLQVTLVAFIGPALHCTFTILLKSMDIRSSYRRN